MEVDIDVDMDVDLEVDMDRKIDVNVFIMYEFMFYMYGFKYMSVHTVHGHKQVHEINSLSASKLKSWLLYQICTFGRVN